ncbi:MAG: AAA family ATPase [Magnetococcus sp. WYHC-3]
MADAMTELEHARNRFVALQRETETLVSNHSDLLTDPPLAEALASWRLASTQARQRLESLQVPVLVIGPPGCGKSTLLKALSSAAVAGAGFPPGVGVTFSEISAVFPWTDAAARESLRAQVRQSLVLVVWDDIYADTASRQALLQELASATSDLPGRDVALLFVLNRVDQRGHEDTTLDERLAALQREVGNALGWEIPPVILPLSSRLLYHAQSLWGTAALDAPPETTEAVQRQHLQALFVDCAASLIRMARSEPTWRSWLRGLEDTLESGAMPAVAELRTLLRRLVLWSGGDALWRALRTRVTAWFSHVVLLSAQVAALDAHQAFTEAFHATVERRRHAAEVAQRDQQRRLQQDHGRLLAEILYDGGGFGTVLALSAQWMKSGHPGDRTNVGARLGADILNCLDTADRIGNQLHADLVSPMYRLLRDRQPLESALVSERSDSWGMLRGGLLPEQWEDVERAYRTFLEALQPALREFQTLKLEERADTREEGMASQVERLERAARLFHIVLRDALVAQAEARLAHLATRLAAILSARVARHVASLDGLEHLASLPGFAPHASFAALMEGHPSDALLPIPNWNPDIDEFVTRKMRSRSESVWQVVDGEMWMPQRIKVPIKKEFDTIDLPDEESMSQRWRALLQEYARMLQISLEGWFAQLLERLGEGYTAALHGCVATAEHASVAVLKWTEEANQEARQVWRVLDREVRHVAEQRAATLALLVARP